MLRANILDNQSVCSIAAVPLSCPYDYAACNGATRHTKGTKRAQRPAWRA
ncbi:hypothetical protein L614_002300000030 [Ochrobactrum sp. J50]|nr:hypothetical protein L614_002300000030 [Ochrobactrum sp. J50]